MRHACWAVWGENNNKIKFVGEITVSCYPQTVAKAQFPQQKPRKKRAAHLQQNETKKQNKSLKLNVSFSEQDTSVAIRSKT
jgi:hypothetical protein